MDEIVSEPRGGATHLDSETWGYGARRAPARSRRIDERMQNRYDKWRAWGTRNCESDRIWETVPCNEQRQPFRVRGLQVSAVTARSGHRVARPTLRDLLSPALPDSEPNTRRTCVAGTASVSNQQKERIAITVIGACVTSRYLRALSSCWARTSALYRRRAMDYGISRRPRSAEDDACGS